MSRNLQPGQVGLINKCPREIGLVELQGTVISIDIGKNKTPILITVAPAGMTQQEMVQLIRNQMKARQVA